ncbi:SMI1/KNR4 family protein [Actinokineospora auranticolor]|uniref:Knr4/Smi1-like domain-containing protein n=1 Tax=Actinokineospora auranticolor TaxID=155976 RepID=A0A2S6GEA4_9PSEU|nr:SMI1/KNR4 family protein [Actinokineospora auranticolor]PPK63565.1 hypothetical protein CLV40_12792 [Actinokineospora auranticolor]
MRVVLAIFAVGGLLIASALAIGVVRDRERASPTESAPAPPPSASRCVPPEGPVTISPAPPALVARLATTLDRLDRWLETNAPATSTVWNRSATAADLATMQRDLGVRLPADLAIALARHDGARPGGFTLPPAYLPLSARDIVTTAVELCERGDGWQQGDLPFARSDSGVLYLRGGAVYRHPARQLVAPSLSDLLERAVDRLEGASAAEYRPEVDAVGTLTWVRE